MIVANLATYPARRDGLMQVVRAIAPQIDVLNVVLNEYDAALPELDEYPNVRQILPPHDTKDAGKFFPDTSGAEYVFLIDDDLVFPDDFVRTTLAAMRAIGPGYMGGYHGSLYRKPAFSVRWSKFLKWLRYMDRQYREAHIAEYRRVFVSYKALDHPLVVDQVATNAAIVAGSDLPSYDYMKDSQKFVDVRLAKWCYEKSIAPVVLPKPAEWIKPIRYDESIYEGFTRTNPPHVAREIMTYAFRVPGRGHAP